MMHSFNSCAKFTFQIVFNFTPCCSHALAQVNDILKAFSDFKNKQQKCMK